MSNPKTLWLPRERKIALRRVGSSRKKFARSPTGIFSWQHPRRVLILVPPHASSTSCLEAIPSIQSLAGHPRHPKVRCLKPTMHSLRFKHFTQTVQDRRLGSRACNIDYWISAGGIRDWMRSIDYRTAGRSIEAVEITSRPSSCTRLSERQCVIAPSSRPSCPQVTSWAGRCSNSYRQRECIS